MGMFPCSVHGAFFRGPAEAAYPAVVVGAISDRRHLRMCHECFTNYLGECEEKLNEAIEGSKPDPDHQRVCHLCGNKADGPMVFVTAYPRGGEPRQFFGPLCRADVDVARAAWLASDVVS